MSIEIGFGSKHGRAKVTLVWFLPGMRSHVDHKPLIYGKLFWTKLALKLLLPCVREDVVIQLGLG